MEYNLRIIIHIRKKKEMNMKKTLTFVIAIFILSAFAFSQVKIGVIDAQQIIEKTKRGAKIQKKLESLQQSKQQKMQGMQDEIKKLEKELLSPALNDETREKKALELQNKRTNLKRYYEDAQREIQRESQKELADLERELMPMIIEIGKSKGFTVIFDRARSGIVYLDNSVDITGEIVKAVDAKFPQ